MSRLVPVVLFMSCLFLAPSTPASACGKTLWGPEHTELTAAEHLIERGRHREAVARVRRTVKTVTESASPAPETDPWVHDRARQLLALAVVRSAGAVPIAPGLGGKRPGERQAAITWAISTMRESLAPSSGQILCEQGKCRTLDDPAHTSALAEALALREDSRDEAYHMLKELSDADLMPTAQGWAVLAALHRQRGELDDSAAAAERCRQTAAEGVRCDVKL